MQVEKISPFLEEKDIRSRVRELAHEIAAVFEDELTVIGLLKGSFMFMADLMRAMHRTPLHLTVDFMKVSSYGTGTESSGEVRLVKDIGFAIEKRNVLIVDDILDSGHSLSMVIRHLEGHRPKRLKTCVLLDKPERRQVSIRADFVGFEIPNAFVVGYGLDFDEHYRELPYIGILET
ncbi:MAG TPA: hypoxanthine phosphoribosyltransferase [bacterium]|nr:hypoxanthine phosphoribosyltransferase [bacterium]